MQRILLCFALFHMAWAHAVPLTVNVNAEAAILVNADTGVVLYEKNARKLHYPASTTKVATALYILNLQGDNLDIMLTADQDALGSTTAEAKLRSNYTLPAYWQENDGTHIGLKKGEQMSMRDLFYGMMLSSGNDAANVMAQYCGGGSIPQFMEGLNRYLKEIGCKHTTFYNPHGLHHPQHQTTAQDMMLIAREAMKNSFFRQVVSTVRYTRPLTNKQEPSPLVQSNMLLRSGKHYYPSAIGIKTGYHARAGHNLIAAAKKEDRTLIAVLLKEKKRGEMFQDAIRLFEAAFQQNKVKRVLLQAGPRDHQLKLKGASKPISTYLKEELAISYYPAEESRVKCLLFWDAVALPVVKDQRVGEIRVQSQDGRLIATAPLFAQEEVKATWVFTLKQHFQNLWKKPLLFTCVVFAFIIFIVFLLKLFR